MSSEDEAVASDLDMHSLILSGLNPDTEPVKTAEEVIKEIDDIMEVFDNFKLKIIVWTMKVEFLSKYEIHS